MRRLRSAPNLHRSFDEEHFRERRDTAPAAITETQALIKQVALKWQKATSEPRLRAALIAKTLTGNNEKRAISDLALKTLSPFALTSIAEEDRINSELVLPGINNTEFAILIYNLIFCSVFFRNRYGHVW